MHTFYLAEIPEAPAAVELDGRDAEHLFRTLRARDGEAVRLFDGQGRVAFGRVAGRTVAIERTAVLPRPAVEVYLYTAVPRKNWMDQLLSQASEVGIAAIVPVVFARSVAQPDSAPERWRLRLVEGCKQSGNPFVPEVRPPVGLAGALAECRAAGRSCFYGAIGGRGRLPEAVPARTAWLVGPEGGFAPEEAAMLEESGAAGICLGEYVMRLETAAIVGAALLANAGRRS